MDKINLTAIASPLWWETLPTGEVRGYYGAKPGAKTSNGLDCFAKTVMGEVKSVRSGSGKVRWGWQLAEVTPDLLGTLPKLSGDCARKPNAVRAAKRAWTKYLEEIILSEVPA